MGCVMLRLANLPGTTAGFIGQSGSLPIIFILPYFVYYNIYIFYMYTIILIIILLYIYIKAYCRY